MATDLKPQSAPASRYEQFVEQQLDRAQRRIRNLDTLTALLILLCGVLLYGLSMVALDRAFDLDSGIRIAAFVVFAVTAAGYAGLIVFRRIQWHVNPYYAARRLEQTIPNAKNSLINWLDLRDDPMPPVIRGTLGRKAAKDLTGADLENAVSARRPLWLSAFTGALFLGLFIWFLMGPSKFVSLLQRAFAPFEKVAIATSTTLRLLSPPAGNATVPVKQDVQIRVEVTGRVPRVNQPDSLRLHYRYRQSDPYTQRPLDQDTDGTWFKTITADELGQGIYYKITGGDTETPEYQITLRAPPAVRLFEATYHYRPYLCMPDRTVRYGPSETLPQPNIKEPCGTEVTLTTRTNCVWRSGYLLLQDGPELKKVRGEPVADDSQAQSFKFVLKHSGSFQVHFTSIAGEANIDRNPYPIVVVDDNAPLVVLTNPGKNIQLPANGTLALDGYARDDHGVKEMTLRMRVKKGPQMPDLEAKPYRPGVSFKLADNRYPIHLTYKDIVALEKLKTAKGEPFAVPAGTVLEYWLEAVDNSDYPEANGNIGKSKPYEIVIAPPDKDQKRQQKLRSEAQQQKQKHDKEQDRRQQARNEDAREHEQTAKQNPAEREKQLKQQREEFEKEAKRIQQELERQKEEQKKKGTAKGDSSAGTGDKNQKNDQKSKPKEGQGSQNKGGKDGSGQQKQDKNQQQAGNGKDAGKSNPQANPPGQAKDQKGRGKEQTPSQAKNEGKQPPGQQAGAGKDSGDPQQKADAGKARDDGKGGMEKAGQQAAGKEPGGPQGQQPQAAQAKSDGKGTNAGQPQQAQTAPKNAPKEGAKEQVAQSKGNDKGQPDASKAKGGQQGQPGQAQQAEGNPNGQPPATARGSEKGPGKKDNGTGAQQSASAKGGDPQKGQPGAAKSKTTDTQQAQNSGKGKGERSEEEMRAEQEQHRREATMDDIAQLKKRLAREEQQEEALDELGRVQKEARKRDVRKAAEELLKKYGREVADYGPAEAKDADNTPTKFVKSAPKGPGQPTEPKRKPTESGEARTQGPPDGQTAGQSKDGGQKDNEQVARKGQPKQGGRFTGDRTGPANDTFVEGGAASPVDQEAARRAGELQLEKLRDRLKKNPNLMKKMHWTEKDLDRFIRHARAYQEWLRQQEKLNNKDRETATGGTSVLPSVGPRNVGPRGGSTRDPLQLGDAQPPPEFREAQRIFTGKTRK